MLRDGVARAAYENVIGWPSTARMTSPALRPPRRPGSPAIDRRARADARSAATPMSPISNRLWPADSRRHACASVDAPSRSRSIDISRFGRVPIAMKNCSQVSTGDPATDRCDRPAGCRPSPPASPHRRRRRPAADPRTRAPRRPDTARRAVSDDRQQQVHHRTHDEHLEPLPLASSTGTRRAAPVRSSSGFSPAIFT